MSDPILPLMSDLPRGVIPGNRKLILASGSPRRKQLLEAAGYEFEILPAGDDAECGVCSRETAPQLVARYAFRKALDVALKRAKEDATGELILAADTVASCSGHILGKPANREHARQMLAMLSGTRHDVYSGVCLWSVPENKCVVDVVRTELDMKPLSSTVLEEYLDTMLWEGKAGAFGYQDGNDWITLANKGSESNVVGLPMERLTELLENFASLAEQINIESPETIIPIRSATEP